jgi:sugar phosphate isomerase/epimerase
MNSHRQFSRRTLLQATAALALPWPSTAPAAPDASKSSSPWKLGCYTRPWDAFEYQVALDGIAEAGFKYAGLMTAKGKPPIVINVDTTPDEAAAIHAETARRGLQVLSIYGGEFPVAKSIADGIAGLHRLIDHCQRCACPNLMLGGTTDEKIFSDYYKVVAECCDYAAAHGVGLSIKPHGGQNATGPQCRKIIERVNHRNFGLWYDPGNIFYYSDGQLDPVADAATVDGILVGMSVKDFLPPKEVLVTPGTGRVDFARVLQRLYTGGFHSGPLIVECLKKGEPAAVTAEARKARQFLESLVATLPKA